MCISCWSTEIKFDNNKAIQSHSQRKHVNFRGALVNECQAYIEKYPHNTVVQNGVQAIVRRICGSKQLAYSRRT